MRNVELRDEDELLTTLATEAQRGETVTLLRNQRPIAQIIPFPTQPSPERMAALERLDALMAKGYDMGGFKIENRDELYDCDLSRQDREEALRQLDALLENAVPLGGTPPTRDEMHDGR